MGRIDEIDQQKLRTRTFPFSAAVLQEALFEITAQQRMYPWLQSSLGPRLILELPNGYAADVYPSLVPSKLVLMCRYKDAPKDNNAVGFGPSHSSSDTIGTLNLVLDSAALVVDRLNFFVNYVAGNNQKLAVTEPHLTLVQGPQGLRLSVARL